MAHTDVRPPSRDLDGLDDNAIIELAQRTYEAWDARDKAIERARELYRHTWKVPVPEGWDQTARTQHTSKSREIVHRVQNTVTLRDLVFSRMNPGDVFADGEKSSAIERFFQGYFAYNRRQGIRGRDAYKFQAGQFVHKGASCVGSLFAPQTWADAPLFLDADGGPRRAYWRDSSGRETDNERDVDYEAASRAYMKAVDGHRATARPPIKRRYLPTDQAYPLLADGEMVALFIRRESTTLELSAAGFWVDTGGEQRNPYSTEPLWEVVTPNRCRYYRGTSPIRHKDSGTDGVVTNYGFIPYSYRAGLEGGDLDYESFGVPMLKLVESNIVTITTLKTYLENAVHMASFTSFYVKYTDKEGNAVGAIRDNRSGKDITTFAFKTGTIMDFGPGREIVPLTHPGLNADFWKLARQEEDELDRMFPRTLSGQAESSGYNTVQATVQAKAILDPIFDGLAMQEEELAIMDMRHISERVPGPVYLEYAQRQSTGSSKSPSLSRIRLAKGDIGNYFQIHVTADKEVDRVTLGTWARGMVEGGIGDEEWAADLAGIVDYSEMKLRQARDRVLKSEKMMALAEEEVIERFRLRKQAERAAAAGRIQYAPDGTPMVLRANGSVAGPGLSPSAQGPAGAALGGANTSATQGLPNPGSTSNPTLALPSPTTPRPRNNGRGGAIRGAPQNPPARPAPQNAAA